MSMPKHLYLFRHAESVDKQLREHDRDRELSSTGIKDSIQIGVYLSRENINLDLIITSSAVRTKATTQLAADAMKFDPAKILIEDELYEASVRTFLRFITELDDDNNSVMCVGHNPTITYLAECLTRAEIGDIATAGLCIIKFNINSWRDVQQGNGELVRYVYPAMLMNN
jgi:phosphohistidine phosphatase